MANVASVPDKKTSIFAGWLIYGPGVVVLFLAILSQYSAYKTDQSHRDLLSHYKDASQIIIDLDESFNVFETLLLSYLSNPDEVSLKNIEDEYDYFTSVYYQFKDQLDKEAYSKVSQKYLRAFYDVEPYLEPVSRELARLDGGGRLKTMAEYIALKAPLDRGVDRLWGLLYSKSETDRLTSILNQHELYSYWSVFLLGLLGFVLVVVNAFRLHQMKEINDDRRRNFKLLEQRLAALEASYDGIGIVDDDGKLIYMNSALMNLHGIPLDECDDYMGTPWLDLYTGVGKKEIKKNIMPALLEAGYWRGEAPIVRKNGEVITAEMSLTHLPGGGVIGTARDITNSKKTAQEKEELQEQFYQAQKMEAVGRLAGGIAHDFNNILAAMNGYAEFLLEDLDSNSPEHQYAKNILSAGYQARALVDQMLAFSRRSESVMGTLNLDEPVGECVSMLKASLPKTIDLTLDIDECVPPVHGNATQISQVLMNLCVNAVDAMEDGHGKLSLHLGCIKPDKYIPKYMIKDSLPDISDNPLIRIEGFGKNRAKLFLNTISSEDEYLCLTVSDTGSGMSRKIMERVFEPFFTTKPVDKGTGLGLANVHGVITSHQGALVIDSVNGEGTSFHLFLPLSKERHVESEIAETEYMDMSGSLILLVEDQEEVRDMMTRMLERLGVEAYACATGLEALDVLKENPDAFDLVITDQNMPKMTGLELVCSANEYFPDLPFILLSGYSEQKLKDLMREHPAIKAILRKPITKNYLGAEINRVLSLKKDTKEAA